MRFKLTPRSMLFAGMCFCLASGELWLRNAIALQNSQIAFSSSKNDENYEIYVMDSDGGNQKRLTTNHDGDAQPAWSPDGQQIAFVSNRGDGRSQIYVMDANGGNPKKLTNTRKNSDPSWSPDGQRIAFTSRPNGTAAHIAVMDADGHNTFKLTDGQRPTWSPDGQSVAFEFLKDGVNQIYEINVNGQGFKRVTNDLTNKSGPAWSPDGQQIAYYALDGGFFQIYVVDADGKNPKRLSHNRVDNMHPAWSPDGQTIAYVIFKGINVRPGRATIHLMTADGKYLKQLSDIHNGADYGPDFGPIGLVVSPTSKTTTIWGRLKKRASNVP